MMMLVVVMQYECMAYLTKDNDDGVSGADAV